MDDLPRPRSALSAHRQDGSSWWVTEISSVSDGRIVNRGRTIEELIEEATFVQHLVFLFSGRMLDRRAASLLEAVMIAGADHGPLAPSIAAARMAATCGVTFNSAIATGINLLGEDHGGAAGNATRLLRSVDKRAEAAGLDEAAREVVAEARARQARLAGFGHQLHGVDPRRNPVIALVESAVEESVVGGRFLETALKVETALESAVGRPVTLNVDGLWGIVCCELDLPADFAMGAFCLSRGAGIMAHAFEERSSGVKIKGPCPPDDDLVRYVGVRPGVTDDAPKS